MVPRLPLTAFPAGSCPSPIDPPAPAYFGNASQAGLWEKEQGGMLRMGSAPASRAALPGLQQGSGGNNPHPAQELLLGHIYCG